MDAKIIANRLVDEFINIRKKFGNNKFIAHLNLEGGWDVRDKAQLKEKKEYKIVVPVAYRNVEYTPDELKAIHADFDALPDSLKDWLYINMLYRFKNTISPSSGTYYRLMSDKFLNEKSKLIKEEIDRWNKDDFGDLSADNIASNILDNIDKFLVSNRKQADFTTKTKEIDPNTKLEDFEGILASLSLEDIQKLKSNPPENVIW
jgi:hypothetical protein